MRKTFAAGLLICSSVPSLQAQQFQQVPLQAPPAEVQWVGGPPNALPPVTYQTIVAPSSVMVTDISVSKGEAKGPGRVIRSDAAVLPVVSAQAPMVPTIQKAPEVPMVLPQYVVPTPNGTAQPYVIATPGTSVPPNGVIIHSTQPTTVAPGPIYTDSFPSAPMGIAGSPMMMPPQEPALWFNADVLYWWTNKGPLPTPLVTTGSPANGLLAGALGQSGTNVLYGGTGIDYEGTWGARAETGMWLDAYNTIGFSIGAFGTQSHSTRFSASDNGTSAAGLYIPARNVAGIPFENRLIIADAPLAFAGGVTVESTTRIWGADANMLLNVCRTGMVDVTPMLGFRYMSLDEDLTIGTSNRDLILGTLTSTTDSFKASNRLYAGQLGFRTNFNYGAWGLGVTAKAAIGFTESVVNVSGSAVQTGPFAVAPGSFATGFFAQGTNSGRFRETNFAVVPEVNAKLSYRFANCVSAHVGYDFMYWNAVVRPGNQLDRNLNLTQSPVFGTGTLVGPAQPLTIVRTSEFYLQGVSAGLEFRY